MIHRSRRLDVRSRAVRWMGAGMLTGSAILLATHGPRLLGSTSRIAFSAGVVLLFGWQWRRSHTQTRVLLAGIATVAVVALIIGPAGTAAKNGAGGHGQRPGTPAPATPAGTGQVLWNADYAARGFRNYASRYNSSRGQIVDDPVLGSVRKVAKLTSDPSALDDENVRVQFVSPDLVRPGYERWIGISYLFPQDFPKRVAPRYHGFLWADLGDIHGPPFTGSPMVQLSPVAPGDGRTRLGWPRSGRYSDWGWIGPYIDDVRGKWIDIVIHTKYSTRPDGFVEIWMDTGSGYHKQRLKGGVDRLYGVTCAPGDSGGTNYHKISHYWPRNLWGNRTVTSYFASHRIGTAFDAVAPHSY